MDKQALGLKIRELRESNGFSQSELAKRIGWNSHTTVVEVEAGRREIKAWELVKLTETLHTDIPTLLGQPAVAPQRPFVLWRKKPSQHAAAIEGRFLQRTDEYAFLEERVARRNTPAESLPLQRSWNLRTVTYEWANQLADQVRDQMGLGAYPAANLVKVLEDKYGVRFLALDLGGDGSAASYREGDHVAMLINSAEVPWRQTFSVAHELFHLVTWSVETFRTVENDEAMQKHNERLAENFAAALLMPHDSVRAELDRLTTDNKLSYSSLVSLARQFGVSVEALLWRLVYLKVLEKKRVSQLLSDGELQALDRQDRRGAGQSESGIGQRFLRLAYQAYEGGGISKGKLARLLEVPLIDVDSYLLQQGLPEVSNREIEISHS